MTTKERLDQLEGRLIVLEELDHKKQASGGSMALLRKVWSWVTENRGLSIFLAIFSIVGGAWYVRHLSNEDEDLRLRVNKQIEDKLVTVNAKLDQLAASSNRMEATLSTLQPFISDLVHQEMQRAAAAKPADFGLKLHTLSNALRAATIERVRTDSKIEASIGTSIENLVISGNQLPDLWNAASAFASYRSQVSYSAGSPSDSLVRCIDSKPVRIGAFPPPKPDSDHPNFGTMDIRASPYVFKDCQMDLKDLSELYEIETHMDIRDSPSSPVRQRIVAPNIFENVFVIYSGESLPKSTLEFRNCIFRFLVERPPLSKQGRDLLLAVIGGDPRLIVVAAPTS